MSLRTAFFPSYHSCSCCCYCRSSCSLWASHSLAYQHRVPVGRFSSIHSPNPLLPHSPHIPQSIHWGQFVFFSPKKKISTGRGYGQHVTVHHRFLLPNTNHVLFHLSPTLSCCAHFLSFCFFIPPERTRPNSGRWYRSSSVIFSFFFLVFFFLFCKASCCLLSTPSFCCHFYSKIYIHHARVCLCGRRYIIRLRLYSLACSVRSLVLHWYLLLLVAFPLKSLLVS